jgi:hypothetical protein
VRGKSIIIGMVAVVTAAVGAVTGPAPAEAATATFPVAKSCADFPAFYRNWDPMPTKLFADETRWVPQGLAYDPKRKWLFVSYYDGRDDVAASEKYRSMLTVTTLAGTRIKTVYFNTEDVPRGGHAGGLAVGRGNLYVATTEGRPRVTRIPLSKIARAENTATLPNSPTYTTKAASYASFHRGRLFVGDFENDRVYRYDTTSKGAVIKKTRVAYPTPTLVQGLAVTDDQFVFSRSYGRTRYSYLTVVDRTTWSKRSTAMPNMSQGITWAPSSATNATSNLYVLFESGSTAYGAGDDDGAATCRTHRLYQKPRSQIL